MAKNRSLGIRIQGIPYLSSYKSEGALFHYGYDPSSLATGYGYERALTEIPASLDESVDLETGRLDVSAFSFALSATESVCKRVLGNAGLQGEPDAEISAEVTTDAQTSIEIKSSEVIAAGNYLYIRNETIYVQSSTDSSGGVYTCSVERGVAGSSAGTYGIGEGVYTQPPFMKRRGVELVSFDLKGETGPTTIWEGFIDGLSTNQQQTEIVISAGQEMAALIGSEGGETVSFSDHPLEWTSNNWIEGQINFGSSEPTYVNSDTDRCNVRIGDVATTAGKKDGYLNVNAAARFNTSTDVDDDNGSVVSEDVDSDEQVTLFCGWSRIARDGSVANDFEGVYGVSDSEAKPASIALALMLSSGDGDNNLVDPSDSSTKTFDVLGRSWGLGIPADRLDAASWLRAIDQIPGSIDRIMLGWDGSYTFEDVILGLLVPNGFYPVPVEGGKTGLVHRSTYQIDDAASLAANSSYVTLNPTKIPLDYRLDNYSSTLKATIGGHDAGEDPDRIKVVNTSGFQSDQMAGQSPHEVTHKYRDKMDARGNSGGLYVELSTDLERRKDNPPILTCEVPLESVGGSEKLPGLLNWVKLKGGPRDGLLMPDGSRKKPDEEEITFVGLLIGRTVDNKTNDVECRVLLSNWNLGGVPRLVAPSAKINSYSSGANSIEISQTLPDRDGLSGFLAGDDLKIVTSDGRQWYGDNGNLSVLGVDDSGGTWTLVLSNTMGEAITFSDDLYIVLKDVDSYSNSGWAGSSVYDDPNVSNRLYAFLADADGKLGSSNQDADIYS